MRPTETTSTHKLLAWASIYRASPLYNKTGDRAFGIGLYQIGQARRWRSDRRTVAESCASGVIWWMITATALRAHVQDHLPPDLLLIPHGFPGWDLFAGQVMEAQQQISYSFGQLKGRNNRFDAATCGKRLAALIETVMAMVPEEYRASGFFDSTNILTRERHLSGRVSGKEIEHDKH